MLSVICNRSIYRSMICIRGLVAPKRDAVQAMPGHFSGVSLFFFRFGLKMELLRTSLPSHRRCTCGGQDMTCLLTTKPTTVTPTPPAHRRLPGKVPPQACKQRQACRPARHKCRSSATVTATPMHGPADSHCSSSSSPPWTPSGIPVLPITPPSSSCPDSLSLPSSSASSCASTANMPPLAHAVPAPSLSTSSASSSSVPSSLSGSCARDDCVMESVDWCEQASSVRAPALALRSRLTACTVARKLSSGSRETGVRSGSSIPWLPLTPGCVSIVTPSHRFRCLLSCSNCFFNLPLMGVRLGPAVALD